MRTKGILCWTLAFVLLAAMGLVSGCSQYQQQIPQKDEWNPKRVAVLPFEHVQPNPGTFQAVSPLSGAVFSSRNSQDEHIGLKVLDASLDKWLHEHTRLQLVSAVRSAPVLRDILDRQSELPLNMAIAKAGTALGAEGVLVGYLYRFERRVGTNYSVEQAASVALDLAMVRCSDGALIWKNTFDERQVSLTENMLNLGNYFKYGLAWYTAEEYAVLGLNETMKLFPWDGE